MCCITETYKGVLCKCVICNRFLVLGNDVSTFDVTKDKKE